jgi:amino acid adenylation domain-containing protein
MTLVNILRSRAIRTPERLAFTFLKGTTLDGSLTYRELDKSAIAVATKLRALGVGNEPVALLLPPGLDFVIGLFGCMYAGAIAVPTTDPYRLRRTLTRLTSIVRDVRPRIGLTVSSLAPLLKSMSSDKEISKVQWLAVDSPLIPADPAAAAFDPDCTAAGIIQYTSGSTSDPKGVILTHKNLLCNQQFIEQAFGQTDESIFAGWLPPYHDMGLIGLILHPVYLGAHCVLMRPIDFLRRPFCWMDAITRFHATATAAPNFALELCSERVTPAERARLDLRTLQVLINGAEPIRPETIRKFADTFASAGFREETIFASYGLAEATLLVSGGKTTRSKLRSWIDSRALERGVVVSVSPHSHNSREIVSCGSPANGLRVVIVNPRTRKLCPPHTIGEIWISGDTVGTGYWRKRKISESIFRARLRDGLDDDFLRTGDLGFLQDSELFVVGRQRDLIIVRGRNIYPQDIERTAESAHRAALSNSCAAFGIDTTRGERVVVAQEVRPGPVDRYAEIAASLRRAVTLEHEVVVHAIVLLKPNTLPRTSSGKVRRRASKAAFLSRALLEVHRSEHDVSTTDIDLPCFDRAELLLVPPPERVDSLVETLRFIIARLSHRSIEELEGDSPLVDFGIDSLTAVQIQHLVENRFGFAPIVPEMLGSVTITDLAQSVVDALEFDVPIKEAGSDPATFHQLSPNQHALWFEYELDPAGTAYNIGGALRVHAPIEMAILKRAVDKLITRHPSLRSTFESSPAGVFQRVNQDLLVPLETYDAAKWSEAQLLDHLNAAFNRPFDLRTGPPLRVQVYGIGPTEYVVLLVAHHIVLDLSSLDILAQEWFELYAADSHGVAPVVGDRHLQYCDYVQWCQRLLIQAHGQTLQSYWEHQLKDCVPALNLPVKRTGFGKRRHPASQCLLLLDENLTREVKSLARNEGKTGFVVFLAAFNALLYRYTQQNDIAIGTSLTVRPTSDFDGVVGYFANTVVLRSRLYGDLTFRTLLDGVRETTLGAMAHAAYPLALLAPLLRRAGQPSAHGLLQAMFMCYGFGNDAPFAATALQAPGVRSKWGNWPVETIRLERTTCQFDLSLAMAECGSNTTCSIEYDSDLFERDFIERLLRHFEALLQGIVRNPACRIADLPLMTSTEEFQLDKFNATRVAYSEVHLLHELVDSQVQRTPSSTAINCEDTAMTYAELGRRSTELASLLIDMGVGPGTRVATVLPPSAEMVVGILGILKAGAAYVPVHPEDGIERIKFLIRDSRPDIIVTTTHFRDRVPANDISVVYLDKGPEGVDHRTKKPLCKIEPEDIAYIMYTSGSTGQPKGVMISHKAICNRLLWMRDEYPLTQADRILQKTPYTFDVSIWELFLPLITGVEMVIARPGGHRDPSYLVGLIQRYSITIVHFVPSLLRVFLEEPDVSRCTTLRRIFASGEPLSASTRDLVFARLRAELHNLYGPTEAAVDVTSWQCTRDDGSQIIPIGRPIANIQLFVLDEYMNRLPVDVPGELYIAGVGLAKGYWDNAELTNLKFLHRPLAGGGSIVVYKSGDRARYRSDGTIEFLGRLDDQVKIRGVRVEPAEVEAALRHHGQVFDCAVIARNSDGHGSQLIAYVVASATRPSIIELRTFLRQRLPEQFVPSQFCFIDVLPKTLSGKVERSAFPRPAPCGVSPTLQPETPEESLLAAIWCDVLGIEQVGTSDNFFELGGDSLRSLQVKARILRSGYQLSIDDLFQNPTIQQLARILRPTDETSERPARHRFSLVSREVQRELGPRFEDVFPLSRLQEVLLFHSRNSGDYEVYVLSLSVRAEFNEELMRETLASLVDRHEMLRVAYNLSDFDFFLQCVNEKATVPLCVQDITMHDDTEQEHMIEEWIDTERHRPFDWTKAPLMRIQVHRRTAKIFQFTVSHPLYDGWSLSSLLVEFFSQYVSRCAGRPLQLQAPLVLSYAAFVEAERSAIDCEKHRAFWQEKLASAPATLLSQGRAHNGPPVRTRRGDSIPADVSTALRCMARSLQVPLKSVLLAAHLSVLSLLTGETDVTTGLITNGRMEEPDGDRVVGLFLNTVPFRVWFRDDTWATASRLTFQVERELWPFRRYPLSEVRSLSGELSFDTAFNFINFHNYNELRGRDDFEIVNWKSPSDFTYFPLCAYFAEDPLSSRLLMYLDYDTSCFEASQIDRIIGYYSRSLESAAANADAPIAEAILISEHESANQFTLNSTATTFNHPNKPIHRLFEDCAASQPEAVAVVHGETVVRYGELNERANRLARYLQRFGVTTEIPVAVRLNRMADMLVAILAILKTGAAFVPLGAVLPPERVAGICSECGLTMAIVDSVIRSENLDLGLTQIPITERNLEKYSNENLGLETPVDSLAYVIYTSGSTGRPKGVEISHASLRNVLLAVGKEIQISSSDKWLAVTPLSFDISILELLLPLIFGASLRIADASDLDDGKRLADLIDHSASTIMQATPATWRLVLEAGWSGSRNIRLLCGGETLTRKMANDLLTKTADVWNMYGPTETTIWSASWKVAPGDDAPPIGRPLPNTTMYVLDAGMRQVPLGVAGELYIGGAGVARGYRNRSDLTKRQFLPDPFVHVPGARMYRTGDRVRLRPDGMLEFIGRLDRQVKIRGFRVEPAEIENVLRQHSSVSDAIVNARANAEDDIRIVAYIIPKLGQVIITTDLTKYLSDFLPSYMIPVDFMTISSFPLTVNGKVDHAALSALAKRVEPLSLRENGLANEIERAVAAVWAEILNLESVRRDESFFALGGHSLLAMRACTKMEKQFGKSISPASIFQHPTVAAFATFLELGHPNPADGESRNQTYMRSRLPVRMRSIVELRRQSWNKGSIS